MVSMSSHPTKSTTCTCFRNDSTSATVTFRKMGRFPFEPVTRIFSSTPLAERLMSVCPGRWPVGSEPASTRNRIARFVIMFLIILSMPMFSVSVFPTMQTSSGRSAASSSAKPGLPSVEIATEHSPSSHRTLYSPGTGGHTCSFTSNAHPSASLGAASVYASLNTFIATAGKQYWQPRQAYLIDSISGCPLALFPSKPFVERASTFLRALPSVSSVSFIHPHFRHLASNIPSRSTSSIFSSGFVSISVCILPLLHNNLSQEPTFVPSKRIQQRLKQV